MLWSRQPQPPVIGSMTGRLASNDDAIRFASIERYRRSGDVPGQAFARGSERDGLLIAFSRLH